MSFLKSALAMLLLLLAGSVACPAAEQTAAKLAFRVVAQEPAAASTLASGDRLFLRIVYDSAMPVRFQAAAWRQEVLQDEAFINSSPPYPAGSGEALAWVGFAKPVRIDTIRVTAFDQEWQQLATLTLPVVMTWEEPASAAPRTPAEWVAPLQKHHRQVFDTALDPLPQKPDPLFDMFLLISVFSFPCYVAMQLRMLLRYRGNWRWYAAAPLLPILPLGLYSLIGIGMESNYWIIFLTRYFPVALAYLGIVWLVKRLRSKPARAEGSP
jgi:hypothetical protein